MKRHGAALAHLESEMNAERYPQALETMRRILGDLELPPDMRVQVSIKQGLALVRLGRVKEAQIVVARVNNCIRRNRLGCLAPEVDALSVVVEEAQKRIAGKVGG